jgi:bifunctional UDP-N-acetylglucosamine pyrophosphorylase/glucosamine-1-phosphate N-acetyltransferase
MDPETIYIDQTVKIGQDTIIWPNTHLLGNSQIDEDCVIGPNVILRDAQVGKGCQIVQAVVENTSLEPGSVVKPFSHLKA